MQDADAVVMLQRQLAELDRLSVLLADSSLGVRSRRLARLLAEIAEGDPPARTLPSHDLPEQRRP